MAFLADVQEIKSGLILFRRTDVKHTNWYCRIKLPKEDRYKVVSLRTPDLNEARDKALEQDADIRFRLKHGVPVFEKSFAQVAQEYLQNRREAAEAGQVTMERWKVLEAYIRLHLVPYVGNVQIVHVNEDTWRSYPIWRKQNGGGRPMTREDSTQEPGNGSTEGGGERKHLPARDGTIRQEMATFRAILNYAVSKQYIREGRAPRGKLHLSRARREEFTPAEYRQLHTFARGWIKSAVDKRSEWYRTVAYNFMLIMTNTGMRTIEARNLLWRDTDARTDKEGRRFVVFNVRGKGKYRELVAPSNVATYLDRIRAISRATKPDNLVFTNGDGKPASTLYQSLIADLLKKSGLLYAASGSRRSSYCFRHTYATYRLMEGVDVYFLAKQMGTSVKMIEDHYGHITPAKNAERILQGIPEWDGIGKSQGDAPKTQDDG